METFIPGVIYFYNNVITASPFYKGTIIAANKPNCSLLGETHTFKKEDSKKLESYELIKYKLIGQYFGS